MPVRAMVLLFYFFGKPRVEKLDLARRRNGEWGAGARVRQNKMKQGVVTFLFHARGRVSFRVGTVEYSIHKFTTQLKSTHDLYHEN